VITYCQWSVIDAQHSIVSDRYKLYYTSDGMGSFVSIRPNIDLKNLQQLDFVTEQIGWAIIDGGLWKTSDGGQNWTRYEEIGYEIKIRIRFRIFGPDYIIGESVPNGDVEFAEVRVHVS